jgi:hypothetical protein
MIHQIRAVNRKDENDIRSRFAISGKTAGQERKALRQAGYRIIETLKHVRPKSVKDLIDFLNGAV